MTARRTWFHSTTQAAICVTSTHLRCMYASLSYAAQGFLKSAYSHVARSCRGWLNFRSSSRPAFLLPSVLATTLQACPHLEVHGCSMLSNISRHVFWVASAWSGPLQLRRFPRQLQLETGPYPRSDCGDQLRELPTQALMFKYGSLDNHGCTMDFQNAEHPGTSKMRSEGSQSPAFEALEAQRTH